MLLAFVAMAKHGNVTRAAEQLNITQQGLSGQIAKLRDLTNDQLFVRVNGEMRLTPRAKALLPKIEQAIASVEQLMLEEEFDPAAASGQIVIAATDYAIALLAPPLIRLLKEQAPNLRVRVRHIDEQHEQALLKSDEVDLVVSVPEFSSTGANALFLFEEHYLGFARSDHPIFDTGKIELERFCSFDHLLVSPFRGDAFGVTDRALAKIGQSRRIGLTVPDFSIVDTILQKTDLISVLPQRLAANMSTRLKSFAVPIELEPFKLFAYWPASLEDDPLNQWLRVVVKHCAEMVEAQ